MDSIFLIDIPDNLCQLIRSGNPEIEVRCFDWNSFRDITISQNDHILFLLDSSTPVSQLLDILSQNSSAAVWGMTFDAGLYLKHVAMIPSLTLLSQEWPDEVLSVFISNIVKKNSSPSHPTLYGPHETHSDKARFIQTLIDDIPNPVFFKDADLIYRGCNREFIELCGIPVERIIGFTNHDVFPPPSARLLDSIEEILARDSSQNHHDIHLLNRNRIDWDIHLCESKFEYMNTKGFLGVMLNMAHLKETEAKLRKAIESAKRANESRTLFLSHITHEIRTPISSMLGILTLMNDTKLNPVQEDYLNILQISGNALLTIINDLMDFSKIEAGRLQIINRPFRLHDCVEEALKVVSQTADEKRLELAYYIHPDTPREIVSDMDRIRQILLNLLSNAIKFTTIGNISIYVDSKIMPNNQVEVHFQVQDTGSGISEDQIEKVFMAFNQADSSIFKRHGGTGLGLTICRQLSELLGGKIWAESKVGHGSTFHFTVQTEAGENVAPAIVDEVKQTLKNKRILGIGSDITLRKIIPLYAESWSVRFERVDYTLNISEIKNALDQADAVIMSVPLYGNRNLGLLNRLRLEYSEEKLPVLVLGSRNQIHTIRDDLLSKKAYTLEKPLKERNLYLGFASALHLDINKSKHNRILPELNAQLSEAFPAKILVCDDNIFEQKIIGNYLSKFGYHADIASTGDEAIQILRRHKYNLLIIDVNLPGRSGIEVAEEIKTTLPVEHQPRIIVSTSYDYQDIKSKLDSAGVDGYLGKPFNVEDLLSMLKQQSFEPETNKQIFKNDDEKLIDFERLEKELMPLEEEMVDVIGTYIDQVEILIGGMRNAYEERNLADLNRFAHSLKSNSLSLGIIGVGSISERIEHSSETDFDPEIPGWIEIIEERFSLIREMLTNKYLR